MSPVKPQDLEELIINPSDSPCVAQKKFMQAQYLYYLWIRYQTAEDGLIADLQKVDLCAIVCPTT